MDADWGGDRFHCCSVTELMVMLAGGVIAYKIKFQSAVSFSSTEVEFTAGAEAGKMVLYLRSILQQLGFPQHIPMIIYEDNMEALFMATADQPTKSTRHMDTKLFVPQDWINEEHISLEALCTQYNLGDQFTKALGWIKFYEQTDVIMGIRVPKYSPLYMGENSPPYRTAPCNTPKFPKAKLRSTPAYNPTNELIKRCIQNRD